MPKQLVLDSVQRGGVNVFKDTAGQVTVQANYRVLAGAEVVRSESKDVTALLSTTQRDALSTMYDDVFGAVQVEELGA
ncbi:MAG: hypothetical protein Q7T26_12525 [Dehalococcoidia bacterium]|nr:hypothetical protein [Dehalococcoidia bacterium]